MMEESPRAGSEELFRQIAERAEDIFRITTPGKDVMEYVSPAYEEIVGYPRDELYENALRWLDHVHPEDRGRVRDALFDQTRGSHEVEYRVVCADGRTRWLRDRAFPLRDESGAVYRIVGVAEDVTAQREALERVQRAEERYRTLVDKSGDVISVVDENGVVLQSSPAIERFTGLRQEELVGTPALERVHPEDRERVGRRLMELVEEPGGVATESYRMLRADGSALHVESIATNLLDDPAIGGIVVNTRDVTEQRQLEWQLRQAQKMEAVGRLAGGIAHDFNNLLTVVRSQADLVLLDLPASSPLRDEIELVRDTADRAAELTGQLLAFSREQMLRPTPTDLNETIRDMLPLLARTLGEDVRIVLDLAQDLPTIRVDPGQLQQVVVNLAVNARDAMPTGGTLRISTSVEEVEAGPAASLPGLTAGTHVRLDVFDTGAGMDEETRRKVFEPFFTTKTGRGGTGLGLATSYGIVKQSGGTIYVESEPGVGTTFTIRFPPTEEPVEPAAPVAEPGPTGEVSGTILVVEDDANVRRVVRRILERSGMDVRTAEDAPTAIGLVERHHKSLDLLLTDLVLAEGSGREILDVVRERFPDLPVIVMSGYAEGAHGWTGAGLPTDVEFLQKPFSPERLMQAVRERLGEP